MNEYPNMKFSITWSNYLQPPPPQLNECFSIFNDMYSKQSDEMSLYIVVGRRVTLRINLNVPS